MFLCYFDVYIKDRRGPRSSSKSITNCKYQNDLTVAAA